MRGPNRAVASSPPSSSFVLRTRPNQRISNRTRSPLSARSSRTAARDGEEGAISPPLIPDFAPPPPPPPRASPRASPRAAPMRRRAPPRRGAKGRARHRLCGRRRDGADDGLPHPRRRGDRARRANGGRRGAAPRRVAPVWVMMDQGRLKATREATREAARRTADARRTDVGLASKREGTRRLSSCRLFLRPHRVV